MGPRWGPRSLGWDPGPALTLARLRPAQFPCAWGLGLFQRGTEARLRCFPPHSCSPGRQTWRGGLLASS